jgi:hypothetical protein
MSHKTNFLLRKKCLWGTFLRLIQWLCAFLKSVQNYASFDTLCRKILEKRFPTLTVQGAVVLFWMIKE